MDQLNSNNQEESHNDIHIVEVVNYLYSYIFVIATASVIAVVSVGVWSIFFARPVYTSSAAVIYNYSASSPFDRDGGALGSSDSQIDNKLFVQQVRFGTPEFREALIGEVYRQPKRQDGEIVKTEEDRFREIMRRQLKMANFSSKADAGEYLIGLVSLNTDSQRRVLNVNGSSSIALLSQAVATLAAQTLINLNYRSVSSELVKVEDFIETQTEETRKKLFDLEDEMAMLQKNERILSISETSSKIDQLQVENDLAFNALNIEKSTAEAQISALDNSIRGFREAIQNGSDAHVYVKELQRRIDYLLYQKNVSSHTRTIASEDQTVIDKSLDEALDEFKSAYEKIQKSNVTSDPWAYLELLEQNLEKSKQALRETEAKIEARQRVAFSELKKYDTLPTVLKKINQVKRNIEMTSALYQQLRNKLQETQIRRAGKLNDLEMLRAADLPTTPTGLRSWKRYVFAFISGLFASIVLLTIRFFLLPTIRNRKDLRRHDLEVIAEVPYMRFSQAEHEVNFAAPLVLLDASTSKEANSIRQARFTVEEKLGLHSSRNSKVAKVLTICSANSKEGKSFVSANLAHSLALAQYKVLLFDLDMLNSSLAEYFSADRFDSQSTEKTANAMPFSIRNVDKYLSLVEIPKTNESLADLLETPAVGEFINSMKDKFDIIVIDTPPIRTSVEPLIASRFSDAIIIVADQRKSLRYDVAKSVDTIRETYDKRIFGVLNFSYDEFSIGQRRTSA